MLGFSFPVTLFHKEEKMNLSIKNLEDIGQSASIKQFTTTEDMLKSMQIGEDEGLNKELLNENLEFMCILFPEDDSEEQDNNEDNEETEESEDES